MFTKVISIICILSFFSLATLAESDIDQWQDSDKTYDDLVDEGFENGINVWLVLILTLTVGVLVGFFIGMFQLISHKRETMGLRSKVRRLQVELDSLRNQAIDDDLVLSDNTEDLNE